MIEQLIDTLRPGHLIELNAPHCHGKTAVACQAAYVLAAQGKHVAYHFQQAMHDNALGAIYDHANVDVYCHARSIDTLESLLKVESDEVAIIDQLTQIIHTQPTIRAKQLQDIRRRLKAVAQEKNIPILLLSSKPDPEAIADTTITLDRGDIFVDPTPTELAVTIKTSDSYHAFTMELVTVDRQVNWLQK